MLLALLLAAPLLAESGGGTSSELMFNHLTVKEGLSDNSVRCIFKDRQGFIWIGTTAGLNKYDGYGVTKFFINNSNLSNDNIFNIFEGCDGNVWIRSQTGFDLYESKTGQIINNAERILTERGVDDSVFVNLGQGPSEGEYWAYNKNFLYLLFSIDKSIKKYPLHGWNIANIAVSRNYIYVMTSDVALYRIDKQTSSYIRMPVPESVAAKLAGHDPRVYADSNETPWIFSYDYMFLSYYDYHAKNWIMLDLNDGQTSLFSRIQQIEDVGHDDIWIITNNQGVYIYHMRDGSITHLVHDPFLPNSIASDNISYIYKDRNEIIWLGNFKQGVSYYSPNSQSFYAYKFLNFEDVLTLCQNDDKRYIYFGTDGKGLLRKSLEDGSLEPIETPANIIVESVSDAEGRMWLGTYSKGLICYKNGLLKQYTTTNSQIAENNVYTLVVDKHGRIWIGTMRGTIQCLDPATGHIKTVFTPDSDIFVKDMFLNEGDILYVATHRGIITVNIETMACKSFIDSDFFSDNDCMTVFVDSRGMVWIGHRHGLSIWNRQNDQVTFFDSRDGLSSNLINAIIEDDNGNIWIGTGNGVTEGKFDKGSMTFVNYSEEDGLMSNPANVHSTYKMDDGSILFGTSDGIQKVLPHEFSSDFSHSEIFLTGIDFKTNNRSGDYLKGSSFEFADELRLKLFNNSFSLHFSTLDFINGNKTRFYFKLDDSIWMNADGNSISLSDLSPGAHLLSVKAYDLNGNPYKNVKDLKIKIIPPIYRSTMAFAIYIAAFLLLSYFIIRFFFDKRKYRETVKEIAAENEKQKKVNEMKLQFFANVSHELRTPLTLIVNPLDEFIFRHPEFKDGELEIARNNADYLTNLINNLLDFRKLDSESERINLKHDDIVPAIMESCHFFEPIAKKKNIRFSYFCDKKSVMTDFDRNMMRKIVSNILSNAFKFTPDNGEVKVSATVKGDDLVMEFTDTGKGIKDEYKEKIFQRFFQSPDNSPSDAGSGIGLYLVKEYVHLHGGSITVHDNHPCGSVFVINLPITDNVRFDQDYVNTTARTDERNNGNEPFTILLVDDSIDLLRFLSESLSTDYRVLTAKNGRQALDVIEDEDVDLVISDVMMPEMDGIELCKTLKKDIRFSHIPIIMLTAKASEEYQMEGLGVGATDYIPKPFNMRVLKLKIKNIIELSKTQKEAFEKEVRIEPSHITVTPLDQKFVEQAIKIVEDNFSNKDFSVDMLANNLNISRSYFYKKMLKITGKKPIEFIRIIRLKRAQQLLSESQMNISEIAYNVGYNSPELFSKHFKEEFGLSPSDYKKQNNK